MARGRHVRRSGLLSFLRPGRASRRAEDLLRLRLQIWELECELHRLRGLGAQLAGRAAEAAVRARRAEDGLTATTAELREVRAEVLELRESLAFAWSEGRVVEAFEQAPAEVVALHGQLRSG